MKKTYNISIGGALFHVEADAFEILEGYINGIRAHFEENTDKEEILRDIEARIAEKFSEQARKIITLIDVHAVIDSMGRVEQFDEDGAEETSIPSGTKRLYLDKDRAMIAGVCSGLGHYFGIDPIIFRILFIASIFAGGAGLIAYIILWLVIPEAKTPSQKLSMKGSAVTISAVAEMIKEKIDEVNTPKNTNMLKQLIAIPMEAVGAVLRFIRDSIFPSIRVLLGTILFVVSFLFAIGTTILVCFSLFGVTPVFIEGPLLPLLQSGTAHALAVALYAIIILPLIFIATLGLGMLMKRRFITAKLVAAFAILWWIAVPVAATFGTKLGTQIASILESDPYYKRDTVTVELPSFTELVITDDQSVHIVQGTTHSLTLKGRQQDLTRVIYATENGVLTLSKKEKEKTTSCMVCGDDYLDLVITVPSLTSITASDNAHVRGNLVGDALALTLDNGSFAQLDLSVKSLSLTEKDGSRVYLSGEASSLNASLQNGSHLDAENLQAGSVTIDAGNSSYSEIQVKTKLNATLRGNSTVRYTGKPTIEKDLDRSSRLEEMYTGN